MPGRLPPCKQRDFIRRLRALGFDGPFPGGSHEYMVYGAARLTLPSYREYSGDMVGVLLAQIELLMGRTVGREEWLALQRRRRREQ